MIQSTNALSTSPSMMAGQGAQFDRRKMMAPVADLLKMSPDELRAALKGGQTLDKLAASKGISHADLVAAIKKGLQDARPNGASDPDGDNDIDNDIDKVAENIATGKAGGRHDHQHNQRATSAGGGTASADANMLDNVSSLLKMSSSDLVDALTKGTSLADIAKQQGVSSDAVLQTVGKGMILKTYA